MTNRENPYLKRRREFSPILNSKQRNDRNITVDPGSIQNLQSHINMIEGSSDPKHLGRYFDSGSGSFVLSFMPLLKEDLEKVHVTFKGFLQSQVDQGNEPSDLWPPSLLEKRQLLEAQIEIRNEELTWLREKIEELKKEEALVEETKVNFLANPITWPPGGSLSNGILQSINGQKVTLNDDGILVINEPRSPYHGMLVWKFKAQIMGPLGAEHRYRTRKEDKQALVENRPKKRVKYPPRPIYNAKEDKITYPDYHKDWAKIKKLKS